MKRSARVNWLTAAIGLVVWFCVVAGLLQPSVPAFGDQADRDLWPLRVSDDSRGFTHADGSPFFPVIDTVWMLSYLAPEDVDFYLKHRPAKGFNSVYVSLAGVERLPAGLNSPNYFGHRPFAQNAAGPDTTRPNPAFFEDFKPALRKLREHKLNVFLTVCWASQWQQSFTRESYTRYVEFVLDQYPADAFPHIVWCLGGDKGMFMQKDLDKPMQIEAGRHLRRLMDARGDRRLIGDHPGRGSSVINYSAEEAAGWLDFYTVQSGHRGPTQDVADWVRQAYERRPAKPVFNGEPLYESHNPGVENADVRWAHWVSVFSGACGTAYGCHGFWGIGVEVPARRSRPGHSAAWWKEHLDDQPVANQMAHFAALNNAYPFHLARPDYVAPRPLIARRGKGAQYVAALISADRRWALVYIPHARTEGAEIQMDLFAGPIRSRWFDPTSGQLTEPGPQLPNTGSRAFEIPGKNNSGQRDWVLVLGEVE
jgi:hypothetical protein